MGKDLAEDLVPDPQVWREFGVTPVTGYRWTHDPDLDFPPPISIKGRNYRSREALTAFKERMVRKSLSGEGTRKPVSAGARKAG